MARRLPPPEKGNRRAVTHGATATVAPERVREQARAIYDELAGAAPVRDADGSLPAADSMVVGLLAEVLCRINDLTAYMAEHGVVQTRRHSTKNRTALQKRKAKTRKRRNVNPLRLVELEGKLRKEAFDYAEALGMTPRSRAKLGLTQARQHDLAREWERKERASRKRDSIDGTATEKEED